MSCSQVFNLCNLLHSFLFQDIPGIVAFLSAKDIPGKNSFIHPGLMMLSEDEEVHFIYIYLLIYILHGPVSSVSIVTEQWAGRSGVESRWGRDFLPIQASPGAHPASCKMGTGSFPGVNCGRGMLLTTHPLLVPQSQKSIAIPLPTLWATTGL